MISVNASFVSNYEVEPLQELPSGDHTRRLYFPGPDPAGGRDGIMLRVTPIPRGDPWIGIFAFGLISPKGVSGIFTCPNPEQLCVVSRGAGYMVAARTPTACEEVKAEPILAVYPLQPLNLLMFADFDRLVAYSDHGLAWRSASLSWDGLRVEEIDGHQLRGKSWSAPENRWVDLAVDLRSGAHQGGASPR